MEVHSSIAYDDAARIGGEVGLRINLAFGVAADLT
jgi:hypothetical protein